MSSHLYAVLTGDLKKSTKLDADALARARDALTEAARDLPTLGIETVSGSLEFYRGDAWQAALRGPSQALRAAVFLRARLKARAKADTRLAIGVGTVERLDPKRVSLSTGDAFTRSGRALDSLRSSGSSLVLDADLDGSSVGEWSKAGFELLNAVIEDWTPTQAEHAALVLQFPSSSQEELGAMCDPPISQGNFSTSIARAHVRATLLALSAFERMSFSG